LDALKGENFSADVFPDFLEAFAAVFRCSVSAETLRSLSLFITFALQDSRAFPGRTPRSVDLSRPSRSNSQLKTSGRERSSSSPSPFKPPLTPSNDLSRFEIGVQMLEVFSDVLCDQDTDLVIKFSTTVTNKWLLFLLAERDARVVVLSTKVLARLLILHGPGYVRNFSEKNGGFTILKNRLRTWWSVPALWVTLFAVLFGMDVSKIDLSEDFDQFTLAEAFAKTSGKVAYPEVVPVMTAMLENGLRAIVREPEALAEPGTKEEDHASNGNGTRDSTVVNINAVKGFSSHEATNNAEVINTVIRFLGDLHLKYPAFREYAATSTLVQELLFSLYPTVVTSDKVSPETELNSRGSALTFEGQDVVIRPHSTSVSSRPPIVRTRTAQPTLLSGIDRVTAFRRTSSFVLVAPDGDDSTPHPKRFSAVMSPTASGSVSLQIGSSVVQGLLSAVIGIYLDQILHRKEFAGFGLFLKVPPGFQEHQAYFKSYVMSHAMSELSNTLRMQEQVLREPRVITNISRYIIHMSDAVFEGWFLNGSEPLMDFVGQTLEYLQRPNVASQKNVRLCIPAIVSMSRVFLRLALLQLSEVTDSDDERRISAFYEKMTYWQTVILAWDNEDNFFLRLFFYLLYLNIINRAQRVREIAADFWRSILVQKPEEAAQVLEYSVPSSQRYLPGGFMKLAELDNEAFLVWIDHHRGDLDNIFLTTLSRNWEDFVTEENRKTEDTARQRLSKRKDRLRLWGEEDRVAESHWRKHENATVHWRRNVYSAERLKHQRAVQDQQDNLTFTAASLAKYDRVLKGPCALFESDPPPKWRLDETEGQNRMRLRTIPDEATLQVDYQPKRKTSEKPQPQTSQTDRPPLASHASKSEGTPIVQEPGSFLEPGRQRASSRVSLAGQEEEYELVEDPRTEDGEFEDKNRKVMRTLQRGDIVQHVSNVSRIEGLDALEGLLIIGKDCLYLIDHYFQRADGEVVGVWQAPSEERDPYLQMISGRKTNMRRPQISPGDQTARHWRWMDVMLISKRRFLLRDVAIEIFFTDGRSYLLTTIDSQIRDELFSRLIARAPLINNPSASLHPEDQWRLELLRNPEEAPQSFGTKFASVFNSAASNPATRRWIKGEMSNFAYLMLLNTMAGRTFNDLTQYPIFPWVIADYTSQELDLSNPRVYRDLSKPMGCQTPNRESEFRDRYNSFSEMSDDPPYHYGTHYSSAMTVTQYLIRLQPFVQSYLILQGGSFDHADRLFYDIGKTWLSASKETLTDVRELTPEFYYLPDFLVNSNEYNFGHTQAKGQKISDVVLPPWAKGDPRLFIEKQREALESPYVSMHLQKWIDLIFGFKQQGEAAVEATNVFHYLSYQGAKDLDLIEDPHERLATIGIIHNFGQTPQQIFHRAHPQRDDVSHIRKKSLNGVLAHLTSEPRFLSNSQERVTSLTYLPKAERIVASGAFQISIPPAFEMCVKWGFSDGSVRFFASDGKKLLALYEHFHVGPPSAAEFVDSRTMITAGSDCVITVWNVVYTSKAPLEVTQRDSFFGHRHPISTLAVSKSLGTLLSADTYGRVLLWDLNRNAFVREIETGAMGREIRSAKICSSTGDIALCIGRVLKLFSLNGKSVLEHDVCDENDEYDYITSCAWYEGTRGEWVEKILLLTGHRNGMTKIWHTSTDHSGRWILKPLKRLPEPASPRTAITCILPMAHGIITGDEIGRVVSWLPSLLNCSLREGIRHYRVPRKRKS
jgi:hypothetical protein